MDSVQAIRFDKEMGITRHDFLRLLPAATDSTQAQWRQDNAGITIDLSPQARGVRIDIADEQVRRIASLRLPVLIVSICLYGFSGVEAEAYMKRFDRHYQRGGG